MTDYEIYTLDQAVKTAKLSLPHAAFRRDRDGSWHLCGRGSDYRQAYYCALLWTKEDMTWDDFVIEIDVGQDQPSCVYAR